jgi:hypothetical protein
VIRGLERRFQRLDEPHRDRVQLCRIVPVFEVLEQAVGVDVDLDLALVGRRPADLGGDTLGGALGVGTDWRVHRRRPRLGIRIVDRHAGVVVGGVGEGSPAKRSSGEPLLGRRI